MLNRQQAIGFGSECRVVVSRVDNMRGFMWKIICAGLDGETVVLSSSRTFKTMHEAHEFGSATLVAAAKSPAP